VLQASLSLTEMFDTAMREAADTRSGELQETAAKKEPLMLTLKVFREAGKAKDLPALMAMRQKEADGGLKGGWGKLGSNLLQGSKEAAAKGHAKVRLSNLLEKEKQVKPLSVEESVVALSAKPRLTQCTHAHCSECSQCTLLADDVALCVLQVRRWPPPTTSSSPSSSKPRSSGARTMRRCVRSWRV
jgi:hypothetical protein